MPKSCLLVFPHCERKRQNNPFQIRTFHFHPFFSSLRLRFTVSYLATFFPKQVYLYGVLSKNSVNRYWVAMAPLPRKRPRQFVSSYSFERVAVLGRIILLLSPGLHSWHALRLRSGCSGPPGYTMLQYTLVSQLTRGPCFPSLTRSLLFEAHHEEPICGIRFWHVISTSSPGLHRCGCKISDQLVGSPSTRIVI